jgi:hypothetical protein
VPVSSFGCIAKCLTPSPYVWRTFRRHSVERHARGVRLSFCADASCTSPERAPSVETDSPGRTCDGRRESHPSACARAFL